MVQNPQFLINIEVFPIHGIPLFSIARSQYNLHFLDYHEMVFLYVCVVFKDF